MDKQIKNGLEEIIAQYEFFSSTTRSILWKTFFWRHALIFPAIPAFILILWWQIKPFKLNQWFFFHKIRGTEISCHFYTYKQICELLKVVHENNHSTQM